MPILVDSDRSWSKVADMLDDPKRRHLVHPEDKEAVEKLHKNMAGLHEAAQIRMKEMQVAVQRAMAPIVSGPGPTIFDQIRDVANIVSPKVNLVTQMFNNHLSTLLEQSMAAHKHFAELREVLAPPTTDIHSLIAPHSWEPVEIIQPYPSAVRIENPEEIAELLADKLLQNQPQLIPSLPTENPLALVDCVPVEDKIHLRILDFKVMEFEGLRASIIHFFYKDRASGQWRTYRDLHHLGMTASIRQAIDEINARILKETGGKVQELISSKQVGSKRNSSKVYRYAF